MGVIVMLRTCTQVGEPSPFIQACKSGDVDAVKAILAELDVDVNEADQVRPRPPSFPDGCTGLMAATMEQSLDVVDLLLLDSRVLINAVDNVCPNSSHVFHADRCLEPLEQERDTAFMIACATGNVPLVTRFVLESSLALNHVNARGMSGFVVACMLGQKDVVLYLKDQEQLNVQHLSMGLYFAGVGGQPDILGLLASLPNVDVNIADPMHGNTALIVASQFGHEDAVKRLLEQESIQINHANKYGGNAFRSACDRGHIAIVDLLLNRPEFALDDLNEGFVAAVANGHLELVRKLLAFPQVDVNYAVQPPDSTVLLTPLTVAASSGHVDVLEELLTRPSIRVNPLDQTFASPLVQASYNGHVEVVNVLLHHPDLDPNQRNDYNNNALYAAVAHGHEAVALRLLAVPGFQVHNLNTAHQNAFMIASCLDQASVVETILALPDVDVNVADVDGKTALLLAVAKAATNVLPLLLAHPSLDVNQTDNNGSSALLVACATGRGDVLRLLLAHPTIDLNLASTDTSTVVLAAALNGAADMLAILVQDKRADVNVVDKL
ncbi:hypothetical protein AaE_015710 [Aphanomyces astaci]|uniref:Uncharacterized protein n=1 Tax=Aphanomyces astaci TaxID=112090 RepID=A0A6A4Z142_APHAT|nr:hypothetical protein AaE_015710 [Aphanomyces astaci]